VTIDRLKPTPSDECQAVRIFLFPIKLPGWESAKNLGEMRTIQFDLKMSHP